MSIKAEIELRPFTVPNFVLPVARVGKREEGFQESPSFALRELSAETIDKLCKQFRHDVFMKAEKQDNFT